MKFIKSINDFTKNKIYYTSKNFVTLNGCTNAMTQYPLGLGFSSFFKIVSVKGNSIFITTPTYFYNNAIFGKLHDSPIILDFTLLESLNIKIIEINNIKSFPFKYTDPDEYNEHEMTKFKLKTLIKYKK